MIFHKFCIYVPKMHGKTHAELLTRYRSLFDFHLFPALWWFFSLKLPIGSSSIPQTNLQACFIHTIICNYWMRIDKISVPIVQKLERMVYHVVCSMSWTPPIKAENLLTISAIIYTRTVSSLHLLFLLLNWFKLFFSYLRRATFTVSSISAQTCKDRI